LRQRRALLLHSRKLIVYFQKGGVREEELAQSLEMEIGEWLEVVVKLPLQDAQIARFVGATDERRNLESVINSIKKARHEARAKLRLLTNK
jgi:leucyl aminopeptidase (aminopeptidase T)